VIGNTVRMSSALYRFGLMLSKNSLRKKAVE